MRVKLKVGKVINGGVWVAGSVVEVPEADAQKLIAADEAEAVEVHTEVDE